MVICSCHLWKSFVEVNLTSMTADGAMLAGGNFVPGKIHCGMAAYIALLHSIL